MKDIMLDLETLGNGKNACIVQIGACYFDRYTGEIGKTFKVNVGAGSDFNGDIDAKTVYWWLEQSDVARNEKLPLVEALTQFNTFTTGASQIWSHATFDFVAICEAYRRCKIQPTFKYKIARDIRTLVDLARVTLDDHKRDGVHHDALDDCFHQVKYCVAAFNALKRRAEINDFLGRMGLKHG
jgi:hypothetical protein